jgi:hypothetical protein
LRRAEYLLALAGEVPSANDTEVLMEVFADRETLAEADGDGVSALADDVALRREACIAALGKAFAGDRLTEAGVLTSRLAYLDKLASEARVRRVALAESA